MLGPLHSSCPGEFCDTRPYQNASRLPLPLAGEVDALAERGGWGKLSSSLPVVTPPPRPPPQAGEGDEQPVLGLGEAVNHRSVAVDYASRMHPTTQPEPG